MAVLSWGALVRYIGFPAGVRILGLLNDGLVIFLRVVESAWLRFHALDPHDLVSCWKPEMPSSA